MLVGQTIGSGEKRFDVKQELGSGAMGTVYRADMHLPGKVRDVALKVVAFGLVGNDSAMARFEREANILKQLRHPNIVKLWATGTFRKLPFIAMEYIAGEPLDRALSRRGRLSWEEVVTYGKQLCDALQYAHEKGIIHRDLKPSNLMITPEGTLKLTDFGIAKDTDVTALTGQNSTIGTASYMSPEQCKGDKNLTFKSDLYSLGVVFFELLSGKKPFYAESTVDMFIKHVNEPPPRLGKLVNELPPKLEALVLQLMAKDKEERPLDAAWVVRMLTEIEEDAVARKSAGLDLATSRRTAKKRNLDGSVLDDSDKDAARALRGKKKKKKKANVPFLEKKWVKGSALGLALAGIIGGAYLALKPPSAEKLAAAIDSAATPEGKLEAATQYLERYGNRPGEETDKAAAIYRENKTRDREKQLLNRFSKKMAKPEDTDDAQAYDWAWKAMEAESVGSLAMAADLWNKVKGRFPDESALPYTLKDEVLAKARWGWLAEKRLGDLKRVDQLLATLRTKIEDNHRYELPFTEDPTSPEGLAIKGLRLEKFGTELTAADLKALKLKESENNDREKAARECWSQLISFTEKEPDKRDWFLLASREKNDSAKPPEDPQHVRLVLIQAVLDRADALAEKMKRDPDKPVERQVRNMCQDAIDLYQDESNEKIKALMEKAKTIKAKVPKN